MKAAQIAHTFTFSGATHNIYHADLGEGLVKHEHPYPHATVCHAGQVLVRKEGKEYALTKHSSPVVLTANEWHEIEAMENGTVFVNVFTGGAQ